MTSLVGSLVGPLSTVPEAGNPASPYTGDGADFAIGNLTFRLAISDERPYERATAQFRKEQFDTTSTYGDQSLVGLWTRGQFSFHKGAGIRYYETLDGETVLDRFQSSVGIEPFEPGEVTLGKPLDSLPVANAKRIGTSFTLANYFKTLVMSTAGTLTAYTEGGGFTTGNWASATGVGVALGGGAVGPAKTLANDLWSVYVAVADKGVHKWTSDNASTVPLWTVPGTTTAVFHAKDRLWIVDNDGRWYMVSTAGGTLLTTDSDFTIPGRTTGLHDTDGWSVCETPQSVLFAYGSKIHRVTVDLQAATPTPTQPELVIELPGDETIGSIVFALGHVAIATNKGVRFAVESGDGTFVYGPLVGREADFGGCKSMAAEGASIIASGVGPQGYGHYHFSLEHQVEELAPAYVLRDIISTTLEPNHHGVVRFTMLYAWATTDTHVHQIDESGKKVASGTLTTGFHRFGTLEPKKFQNVNVRVGGDGGTVTVSKVLFDGSSVPLLSMDVAETDGEIITLRSNAPLEVLGLKFTLERDASDPTKGPILFGYQLRVMPAPVRQRMIRVPLKLFDVERSKGTPTAGHDGSAWERLEALEDMERSGASYVFQDFRTGEAGECFIEQIEHRGTTPPGPNNSGYGGIVWLTLRKL